MPPAPWDSWYLKIRAGRPLLTRSLEGQPCARGNWKSSMQTAEWVPSLPAPPGTPDGSSPLHPQEVSFHERAQCFLLPPGPPTPKQLEMSLYVPAPDRDQRVCRCHCRVATSPAPAGPGHLRAGLEMRDPHGCPGTRGAGEGQREIISRVQAWVELSLDHQRWMGPS